VYENGVFGDFSVERSCYLEMGKFPDEIRRLEIQGLQSLKTLSQNLTASFAERVGEHNFRRIAGDARSGFSEMG
jgi:hypothetical protein